MEKIPPREKEKKPQQGFSVLTMTFGLKGNILIASCGAITGALIGGAVFSNFNAPVIETRLLYGIAAVAGILLFLLVANIIHYVLGPHK